MLTQIIFPAIAVAVPAASLALSLVKYYKKRPHLKINIDNKSDCFFAVVGSKGADIRNYVSILHFDIVNSSPVKITISNAYLMIDKEKYLLADSDGKWESVNFFYENEEGAFESDEIYRDYDSTFIKLPLEIAPYQSISASAIFYLRQSNLGENVKAKLILGTAIGKIRKKIVLSEYSYEQLQHEFENVTQYQRSIVGTRIIMDSQDQETASSDNLEDCTP